MKIPRGKKKGPAGLILAAGGVLWNRSSRSDAIALVSRVKYGDWTLPKGKLKRGETFEGAALREVREETGCRPGLEDFIGLVQYKVRNEPKVVLFWNMRCRRKPTFRANEEIAKLIWLSPERALRRMTYAAERKIVRMAVKAR
jgi:8-oxo-dGTP diphosphatase